MRYLDDLFSMADEKYKAFHAPLIPNVDPENIIGVRTPLLRAYAKKFAQTDEAETFLSSLPHKYYEENNLHAFLLERIRDYDRVTALLDAFLPYVDNWATCDMMNPKILKKYPDRLLADVKRRLSSKHTYEVRFAVGCLMNYFLDENFSAEIFPLVINIHTDEYYINMMRAWFFATALAKQYESALPVIENRLLDNWTHNKAIQKAVESRRITPEQKAYLKTLKI